MIPKECIHFSKANRLVKEFVNSVANIPTCSYEVRTSRSKRVTYAVIGYIEDDEITILIPNWKKVDFSKDDGGKAFRKDFVNRFPSARGFSDVTLSLLHEIGHTMTKAFVPPMNDEIDEYNAKVQNLEMCDVYPLYFALTDERMATDWAINWLKNAENRKLAKKFEKKFSTCFVKG